MEQVHLYSPQALHIARVAFTAFFTILFVQSGGDKIFNFRENLSWLVGHFKNTLFGAIVPVLFVILALTEVSAGLVSAYGLLMLIVHKSSTIAFYGAALSVLSLLMLFMGQRIAKDYGGASGLVAYFIASIFALMLLA